METKVKFWAQRLFLLLLEVYVCGDGSQRPQCSVKLGEICASSDSDTELQFQQTLTCNKNDHWRLKKNDKDIYFCRYGHHDFPDDSERSNLNFTKMSGSFKVVKVQQSDTGLYKLCDHNDKCTCVQLVMRPDGKSCDEAPEGHNGQEMNTSLDSINPANNSSINGTISGRLCQILFVLVVVLVVLVVVLVVLVVVLVVLVVVLIKKNRESTQAQHTDLEMGARSEAARDEERNNQDMINPLLGSRVQSENTAS
ncbi:uncharacterized protein LOC112843287 [Oreochromis niloticus]|uniref:uncharacterized protein LOC112843287 n=1 Tax=Oreochromis niloticus TaxID=8128 RepID=UPI000DF298A3|nr:uncharacterized protein LOC112843287 [Oreochromis niloticus]